MSKIVSHPLNVFVNTKKCSPISYPLLRMSHPDFNWLQKHSLLLFRTTLNIKTKHWFSLSKSVSLLFKRALQLRLNNRGINLCQLMSGKQKKSLMRITNYAAYIERKLRGKINTPWVLRIVTFYSESSFFSGLFCGCLSLKSSSLAAAHLT